MIRSKTLPVLGGGLMLAAAAAAVGAFAEEQPARRAAFAPKEAIEAPTKRVVAQAAAPAGGNPKVQPGRVRWHADFVAACAAARTSKKPVLLFQMMGKLDDQFC